MVDFKLKDKLEERDIILEIVKDVSKKFLIEFKSGNHKKIVYHGDWSEEIVEPDSRKEVIQGVELLTSLLKPHFKDKKVILANLNMTKKHGSLVTQRKKLLNKLEKKQIDEDVFIRDKLILMRDWFGELIFLLHATGYLKAKKTIG